MLSIVSFFVFFFFSSRRRHTRCGRDWSSDVCSSDLLWSTTITAPAVLHRSAASPNQEPYTLAPANGGAFHDLPLVAQSMIAKEINLTAAHHTNETSIQTAPEGQPVSPLTRTAPIGGLEAAGIEANPDASKQQIDLDELVEKAWQKLMRKLTIEQERRGGMT